MQAPQPVTKDTMPAIRELAREWLYDNDLPAEWENAVALEFDAAISDRKLEIVSTHEQGRPYDMALVEWVTEHRQEVIPAEAQR